MLKGILAHNGPATTERFAAGDDGLADRAQRTIARCDISPANDGCFRGRAEGRRPSKSPAPILCHEQDIVIGST